MASSGAESFTDGLEPPEVLGIFKAAENQRLDYHGSVLETAWPIVSDLELCNALLIENGRSDLQIHDQAPLQDFPDVLSMADSNNFGSDLKFYMRFDYLTRYDSLGSSYQERVPVSITPNEYDDLLAGTLDYQETPIKMTAFRKPAFHRMATLFPEFTKQLILTISNPNNRSILLLPELFVVYKIMSQIVDLSDPSVVFDINQDGNPTLDPHYLTT
ncbi:MAG TPA: hypothetical protein VLG47_03805 [Candidatus Saccharimonadales bacterium]|nr:hypothetical protein [Candidatus Saccharimonadales bacterium]